MGSPAVRRGHVRTEMSPMTAVVVVVIVGVVVVAVVVFGVHVVCVPTHGSTYIHAFNDRSPDHAVASPPHGVRVHARDTHTKKKRSSMFVVCCSLCARSPTPTNWRYTLACLLKYIPTTNAFSWALHVFNLAVLFAVVFVERFSVTRT